MVGGTKPGTKSSLTVFRRGTTKELSVVIAEIEAEKPVKKAADKPAKPKESTAVQTLGLVVSDLTEAQRKELKLKGGVSVDSVSGSAERAGVREGDVITAVLYTEILTAKEFEAAIAKIDKTKPIPLLVRRGDSANFLVLRPQPRKAE